MDVAGTLMLPVVVSKLYKAINSNGGVTYIHCTAGLGRAPAVAVCLLVSFMWCKLLTEYLPEMFFVSSG